MYQRGEEMKMNSYVISSMKLPTSTESSCLQFSLKKILPQERFFPQLQKTDLCLWIPLKISYHYFQERRTIYQT